MNLMKKQIISVSQLNQFTNMLLEGNEFLGDIYVRGEISNFKKYSSGHLYFSLKDEAASLAAVMWRSYAARLPFDAGDGLKVIAHGRVSLYEASGRYQIIIDSMEPDGIGSLYYAYEQLKSKLSAEGLFDEAHKKTLPRYPRRVGIVTSPTGAAIRDMVRIITRRFPLAEIVLYPSLVQGHGAAVQVASGIEYFNETRSADVIIIGRGGGSIEDLWEFNNEMLARRIYASDIPIISAVGHESDFTISDFVSDVRASTPSAAAELAVPERSELAAAIGNIRKRMSIIMDTKLNDRKLKLSHLASSQFLKSPLNFVDAKRLETIQMQDRLDSAVSMILERKNASLKEKAVALNALSPLAVLTRGYSVSYSEDGKPVKSVRCVREGDNIINEISDGVIYSTVTSTKIKRGHKNGKENGKF